MDGIDCAIGQKNNVLLQLRKAVLNCIADEENLFQMGRSTKQTRLPQTRLPPPDIVMSSDSKCSRPKRLMKRARKLDYSDAERSHTSQCHRLPTPSIPDHCLGKILASPNIVPTQPKSAGSLERLAEANDPQCASESKRRILNWLVTVPPHCSNSEPVPLTGPGALTTFDSDGYQHPSVEPFHDIPQSPPLDMPQSQGQSLGEASGTSARSSRAATSGSLYRSILWNNGVRMDHTGDKIPEELRKFLDADILKRRTSRVSPEAVAATVNTAVNIADSTEGNMYDLVGTAMFPVKRYDVGRGSNTLWSTEALPRKPEYPYRGLATPKPDVHIGYPTAVQTTWTLKENAVVDHPAARPYAQPTRSNRFPFLIMELKSEAAGGTLWQAENQAAGGGAHCVNSMRWLLREVYPSRAPSILDTVAFTIAATHREAIYHIHFYSEENDAFYMSWIGTFSTLRGSDIQGSNEITENILEHGLGTRQQMIRSALRDMWPRLERWKPSRPASVLDSQADSEQDLPADGQGSARSLRLV